jgi:hypothetical protein
MNTTELRNELIARISGIEDVEFLNAIKTILDYKKAEKIINLTKHQEQELTLASEEAKSGQYLSQSDMDKKVKEWLKEK